MAISAYVVDSHSDGVPGTFSRRGDGRLCDRSAEESFLWKVSFPRVGGTLHCCVPLVATRWYRAQVREVSNEGREAVVFFPDYGDTVRFPTDQLLTVLPSMMMLPYQAVQCSLAGVQPQGQDGWAPTAGSMLEDFGYDGSNNNRPLCLWVARQVAGGGGAYEVFLFDACLASRASAADRLIERGLAAPTELPLLPDTPSHKAANEEETETREEMSGLELVYHRQLEEQMFSMLGECARLMREDVLGGPPEGRRGAAERAAAEPSLAHSTEVAAEKPPAAAGGSSPVLGPAAQEEPQATPADKAPKLASVFGSGSSSRARVSWWQDRKFVHATVLIPDAVSYRLEMTALLLHLRVWVGGKESVLCERLFAPVKPEKTKLARTPQGIKLTLEKECPSLTWDFFTLQKKKLPHIRYDLDHLTVSDDEDDVTFPLVASSENSSEEDNVPSSDENFPGFVEGTRIMPFDPVAHGERLEDIEDAEHDDDLPLIQDPDDMFEGF